MNIFVYQKALIQSFHTSFLDYKITFVNSQIQIKEHTFVLKVSGIQYKPDSYYYD